MNYKWLNRENNQNLIVFFNGWGMDETVVKHLNTDIFDILMFYNYNNLETDFDFELLKKYSEKYLISWSMGVMLSSIFSDKLGNLTSKTAINGTLKPIDNQFGIPVRIYDLTIRGFNEAGAEKFINNMFNIKVELPKSSREFEEQKSELVAIKGYQGNENFKYDKIFISNNDKIIPTKNQIAFWKQDANIESGHCPFFLFESWKDLI